MDSISLTETARVSKITDLLARRAASSPEMRAYTLLREDADPAAISYGQLDRRARAVAAWLAERCRPGDRALLLYPPGIDFLAGFFGCLYAGVIAVPLPPPSPRQGAEKLALVMRDTGACVALTTSQLASDDSAAVLGARLTLGVTDAIDDALAAGYHPPAAPTEPAYLQYTSGSTSSPRGVMITHANVLHNLANIDVGFAHTPDSVVVTWLPHFHDMGLIYGLLAPLFVGMPCYFFSPAAFVQRPRFWLEAITRYRATHSGGPNFAYDLCVRRIPEAERAGLDLSSWEVAFNGAEPVHAETLERFCRAFAPCGFRREAFYPAYGLAEAALKVSGGRKGAGPILLRAKASALARHRVEAAPESAGDVRTLVSCGAPGLDTEVVIADPETCAVSPPGAVGEVWVRGPGVAQGYWGRPRETEETFGARLAATGEGPFLRTGDLGFLHEGELFLVGRRKDLIIIRGLNHHPADLELTARKAHPVVATSVGAAFAVEAAGEERLVIVLESPRREPADPETVAQSVRQKIAEEHRVGAYAVVLVRKGGIPKTSSGKIQRGLCKRKYESGELPVVYESRLEDVHLDAPADWVTPQEVVSEPLAGRGAKVARYVRQVLGQVLKARPEVFENNGPIAAYGLDSLLAVELQNRLRTDLGVTVPAVAILEGMSVAGLAETVTAALAGAPADADSIRPRGADEFPLSFEQERLWLLDQLLPRNPAYHIPFAFRVRGPLDAVALEHAAAAVAERQESLRTVFAQRRGRPVCVVRSWDRPPFEVEDLSGVADHAREEEVIERVAREVRRPFDLAQGPLWRLRLYRVAAGEWVALVVMHHIISDVWSVRIFLEELFEAYEALVTGDEARVEALPVQYGDFAAWQRQRFEGERLAPLAAYWGSRLEGAPPLRMPADRPRPETPSFQGGLEAVAFPRELSQSVREYARGAGVTLFSVLMAGFEAFAARASGQTDVVIGTTNANRGRAEIERLVGFFAAPLVVRVNLAGDPTYREILDRVSRSLREAYAHQELPFAKVVEASHPGRQSSYTPLFQIMFSVVRSMLPATELPDLELEALEIGAGATDFDLFVNVIDEGTDLRVLAIYNKDIYDGSTVRALVASYLELMETAVRSPGTRLSDLPAAAVAARVREETVPAARAPVLAVTATFTAEPLEEVLRFWLRELGYDYEIRFAPYNQVFQQLLDPASLVGRGAGGVNVVLVRLEDWTGGAGGPGDLEENVRGFLEALHAAARRVATPFFVCLCPASPGFLEAPGRRALAGRLENSIYAAASGRVFVFRSSDILALYPVDSYYDAHGERLGHMPYTPEFFAALGTFIARKLHALRTTPFKVAALDCDQTLWKGVCGEDGPAGVEIDGPRRELQRFMLERRSEGMLLTLVSKNAEEDVWAVFAAHPEMPLRREHFAAWRINWDTKSAGLREMARELDLGLDSFLFVDDSPTECAEVEADAPEVLTLQLPTPPERIGPFLRHVWAFDRLTTTEEDRRRAEMYGQRQERRRLQKKTASLAEFLEALDLRVTIRPAAPADLPRVAQLTQRTNQFNLSSIRRTESGVQDFLRDGECLVAEVSDRFGSYGLVGVAMFRAADGALDVDTLLLSCRALGRGVEHRMLARLGEIAVERGLPEVRLPYRRTPKNKPALQFLETLARARETSDSGARYGIPSAEAAAVHYLPDSPPGEPESGEEKTGAAPGGVERSVDYARIAAEWNAASAILDAVRAAVRVDAVRTTPYEAPRTPLEKRLAALWAEMLNVPEVGVNDNFFDLGGHSLLAVQLLSRVREEFQADLSLDVVFSGIFSVAELAKAIELHEIERAGGEEYEALLAEIEGLSDEEVRALLEKEGGDERDTA